MHSSLLILAVAAEEAEKADIMKVHPGLTFWTIVTFVVALVILRFTAWKPMMATLDEREKTIREAIEGAKRERLEAERLLEEQKAAVTAARKEVAELVRKNQAEVEAARQKALEKAEADAEALITQARRSIDEERKKAVAELKTTAVDLAIAAAGKLIEANLDEAKQRQLAEDFLEKLPTQPQA